MRAAAECKPAYVTWVNSLGRSWFTLSSSRRSRTGAITETGKNSMSDRDIATVGPVRAVTRSVLLASIAAGLLAPAAFAAKPVKRPPAQGSFTDHLDAVDSTRWAIADGWTNSSPFDNAWRADHVGFHDGWLDLRLDDVAALGQPYSSGEYRTVGYFGYGCYETSMRPVARAGVVSSFFTFAGPFDNGGNGKHNEIDIEFLGYDTTRVQLNFWTNDDAYAAGNEVLLDLGFDAAADFHRYAFKWTARSIAWYVDGTRVYEAFDTPSNPVPKAADSLQKIMMNVWPVDATAAAWAGEFVYAGQPEHGLYDWVRYTAGEECEIGSPPDPPPPPPTGDPAVLHVDRIEMSLGGRGSQAIASVGIVDGLGQPVAGVAVAGAWSGAITGGDTSRTTSSLGIATFYSSRSKAAGSVQFCVTSVTANGKTYDAAANGETCDAIAK
jgi:beta-glucanase (GH16 family)